MLYATAWQVQLFDILIAIFIIAMITCFTTLLFSQRKENRLLREQTIEIRVHNGLLREQNATLRSSVPEQETKREEEPKPLPMPTMPPVEMPQPNPEPTELLDPPPVRTIFFATHKGGPVSDWIRELFGDLSEQLPADYEAMQQELIAYGEELAKQLSQ